MQEIKVFGTYTNEGKVLGIFIGLISAATQSELKKENFLYIFQTL